MYEVKHELVEQMKQIRLLHTSDIHIGARFDFLGSKGNEQREAIRNAFTRIAGMAGGEGFDLLLIAGDLFDSAYQVAESDLAFVLGALADTGGCRTVILPGSHDFWGPGGVYEREHGRFEAAGTISILSPERPRAVFDDLSVAVTGVVLTMPDAPAVPIAGIGPDDRYSSNILMLHGSVAGAAGVSEPGGNAIELDTLESGFDYVALGHWHSYLVVAEAPHAVYSGSPELIARDQRGAGSAVSVVLSEHGPAVERVPIGVRRIRRHAVDCTALRTTEELVRKVVEGVAPDADTVLELTLLGIVATDAALDPALATQELERRYFSVRLSGDPPERFIPQEELLAVPGDSVAGRFVRLLLERIDGARGAQRRELEEALQIGYQLFRGRNPLG